MDESKIKEKFEQIYKAKIEPHAKRLEPYRIEQKKKHDIFLIALICVVLLFFLGAFLTAKISALGKFFAIYAILTFILLPVLCVCLYNLEKEFRKKTKEALLKPLLLLFGSFLLSDKELISLKDIKSMGLYQKAKKKKDDDNITGTYKGFPVSIVETKLTHTEAQIGIKINGINIGGTGGKSSSSKGVTDFEGLIFKIKMNKSFNGIIVGEQKRDIKGYIKLCREESKKHPDLYPPEAMKWLDNPIVNTVLDTVSEAMSSEGPVGLFGLFGKNKVTSKLNKIDTQDLEFNSNYEIYTDNQSKAKELLTKEFTEKIKNTRSALMAWSIDFAFDEGYIYIFVNSKSTNDMVFAAQKARNKAQNGFFEVGNLSETLLDKTIYLKTFRELIILFSLIASFNSEEKPKTN